MNRLVVSLFVLLGLFTACGADDQSAVSGDAGDPIDDGAPDPGPTDGDGSSDDPPLGAGPYPIADLAITYTHDNGTRLMYRITCLGDTATVSGDDVGIRDSTACLALADQPVQQRLTNGAPTDRACTEIYGGSDMAAITGRIDDIAVDTTVDRTNGCGIDEWDNLLGAILPAPIGA